VIPSFDEFGRLPSGVHKADWCEITGRLGTNPRRRLLLEGLKTALDSLRAAGCQRVYLDGSFVTAKEHPADFDACWDVQGVDATRLDPVLLDFSAQRAKQKAKYSGELFPAQSNATPNTLATFLEFFQAAKEDGSPKGIILIDLGRFP